MNLLWDVTLQRTKKRKLIDALKSVILFSDLDIVQLKALQRVCHIRSYKDKEVILEKNTPAYGLYIVLDGGVEIYLDKKSFQKYEPFEYFGEFSLLPDHNRSADARAIKFTKLCYIHREEFRQLFLKNPALGIKIYENILKFLVEKLERANAGLS